MNWFTKMFLRQPPAPPATAIEPPARATSQDFQVVSVERVQFGGMKDVPRYNPDELVRRKGLGIYAKMRLDEQVKAVVTFKRDAVLSRGWTFEYDKECPLNDDEKAQRIREYEYIVRKMPGSFIDALNRVATGREYGYSLTEKQFSNIEIDGETRIGIQGLHGRDPKDFEFITDPYGNLIEFRQLAGGDRILLDINKFIHYVHNPEFDRYYGQSELREAYRSWYHKDVLLRYWGFYMEKLGGGMMIVQLDRDSGITVSSPEYRALQSIVENVKASAGIVLPPGASAEVVFPSNSDAFKQACEYHDLGIAKALLVPNLMGVTPSGQTGSYSQSSSQLEAFAWTVRADTDRLESCIDEQLFRHLGDLNYGDGEYPRFKFKPLSTEGLRYLITTWSTLIKDGAVIPTEEDEARLREILEMPPRTDKSVTLMEVKQELMPAPTPTAPPSATADKIPQDQPKPPAERQSDTKPTEKKVQASRTSGKPKLRIVASTPDGQPRTASARGFSRALMRVEFSVIEHKMTSIQYEDAEKVSSLVAKAVSNILADDRLPQLLDSDVRDISDMQLDSSDKSRIKAAMKASLQKAWEMGQNQARKEMSAANKPITFASLRDKAAEYFDANGFRMAGNLSDGVRGIIQNELLQAVKRGARPEEAKAQIYARLIEKGMTSLDAVKENIGSSDEVEALVEDLLDAALPTANVPAYLNTLIRTNTYEALNEARYAEFTDPEIRDFVVALEYSAVLDDATTELCRSLDGHIHASDSEVWDTYRPPNHFNCRSLLVPVTAIDEWDGRESAAPRVEPAKGFSAGK